VCGIFGAWNLDGAPVDRNAIIRSRDALIRRGPDDAGEEIIGNVGLAHRRLSIIDLSPLGRMPMANEDRSVWAVFNGEIYNFKVLRAELESFGHRFVSQTDSEVIVHAYEQWGTDCFARFDGMFAIAIWDGRHRQLVLARDPHGKKPLFVYDNGKSIVFGSTLAALVAWPSFERRIDANSIAEFVNFGYIHAPASIFANTKKVRPGSYVVYDESGANKERTYWSLCKFAEERAAQSLSEDEAVERTDSLLLEAVRKRLIADVPVGAFLSGGVDSSLVVAMLKRLGAGHVKTFTIGFDSEAFDESQHAQQVASMLGVENRVLRIKANDLLAYLPSVVEFYDEPMADFSLFPVLAVSELARKEVAVVLTGDGADEMFGGYERLWATHWFSRYQQIAPAPLRAVFSRLGKGAPSKRVSEFARKSQAGSVAEFFGEFLDLSRRFGAQRLLRDGLVGQTPGQRISAFCAGLKGVDPTSAAMMFEATHTMVDGILVKVDRGTMAYSLEARSPFLDKALSEFAAGLPMRLRFGKSGLGKKVLLKKTLARYLPESMFARRKQGFTPPLRDWFRHEWKEVLSDSLSESTVARRGFFKPAAVQEMLASHASGDSAFTKPLWAMLMLELWMQRYA